MRTIILVEGVTDELALTLAARRLGRDLEAEGVSVLPMKGVHAIDRFLRRLAVEEPGTNIAGLYDEGEEGVVRAALGRAGYGAGLDRSGLEEAGFFACRADLEDELIRAAGEAVLSRLVELEGRRAVMGHVPQAARLAEPAGGSAVPSLHPERFEPQQPVHPRHRRDRRSIRAASTASTAARIR